MTGARFKTEADLCAAFLGCVGAAWVPYAETAGWDILLVRRSDGVQIGIEAKLRLNAEVVAQALEGLRDAWSGEGPDYRAVLVPEAGVVAGAAALADHIGISLMWVRWWEGAKRPFSFYPALPEVGHRYDSSYWHEWSPLQRHQLPAYVPDVAAGASGPVQLTDWKVRALKLAVLLEHRGHITRADFKAIDIDPRRWTDGRTGWLRPTATGYVAGAMPDFKGQHPRVYAELLATIEERRPRPKTQPPQQPSTLLGAG
jgi:hypothetical protein